MIFKPAFVGGLPLALIALLLCYSSAAVGNIDHSIWDRLLRQHVQVLKEGKVTRLDYGGVRREQASLTAYLELLASVSEDEFESWESAHQLAFLINAYNAWTVQLILSQEPDLESIRDIGFLPNAAWRRNIVELFDNQFSLDDVEHGMIRGWDRYHEPRIHFAVNCAAIGCPALRWEAYEGDSLDAQLEDATILFLSDSERNYKDANRIYISRIFDWYEEDFERGWTGIDSVEQFLLRYVDALSLDAAAQQALGDGRLRIRYSDYDWDLNRRIN